MPIPLAGLMALWPPVGYAIYRNRNKNKVDCKRRIERDAWREWIEEFQTRDFGFNTADPSSPPSRQTSTVPEASSFSTTLRDSQSRLEIRNENDESVMSIFELSDIKKTRWTAIQESTENPISRLNPLLSAVPIAAISGNIATTKYMAVQLAGDLTKAANDVGFRAWTVNEAGIKEHARLFSPDQLNGFVSGATIWQIASIIVAQKHLADINKKLERIGDAIEEVRKHQEDKRLSTIMGCREYFVDISEEIELNVSILDRLEDVIEPQCVELLKIENHLRLDLQSIVGKMEEDDLGESLNREMENFMKLVQHLLLCIETKLIGYNLMAIGSKSENVVIVRLNKITRNVEELETQIIRVAGYIVSKLSEEVSFWGSIGKFEETLVALKKLQPRDKFENLFEGVYGGINMVQNIVEQKKAPREILLKVNGQEVEGFAVAESGNI